MLESDSFSHTGEDGSSPHARMADAGYPFEGATVSLENIGWQSARGEEGYADDVEDIHEGLMQSPGHRANILNPEVQDIGLGVEIGTFTSDSGDFEAVMVTEVFARTDADVTALIDPGTLADDTPDETPDEVPDEMPDETPDETPDEAPDDGDGPTAEGPEIPLPCGLEHFTFDLTSAFEFRQEGDEYIWETSEEKLVEAFLNAFRDWTETPPEEAPDVVDIIDEGASDEIVPDDEIDGWCCRFEPEDEDEGDWMEDMCA
jgi:hypothetical protein